MKFTATPLKGAYLIDIAPSMDERGFLARTFCQKEFKENGLHFTVTQTNLSFNKKRGTLRGMHYQIPPFEEAKVVQCTRGAIYDVIIDLRAGSPTFKSWYAIELTQENRRILFVPEGFAHGFQTLEENTEVFYLMSKEYHPNHSRGVLWNDEAFGIPWPIDARIMSMKDCGYEHFR